MPERARGMSTGMHDADPRSAGSSAAPARDPAAAMPQAEAAQAVLGALASQAGGAVRGEAGERSAGQQRSPAGGGTVPGELTPPPAAAGPGKAVEVASAVAGPGPHAVPASAKGVAADGGDPSTADPHGCVDRAAPAEPGPGSVPRPGVPTRCAGSPTNLQAADAGAGAASGSGAGDSGGQGEHAGFRGRLEVLLRSAGGFNRPPPAAAAGALGPGPDLDPVGDPVMSQSQHNPLGEPPPARQAQAVHEPGVGRRGRAQGFAGPSAQSGGHLLRVAPGLATPAVPGFSAWLAPAADTPLLAAATGRQLPEWLTPAPLGGPPSWLAAGTGTGLRAGAAAVAQPPEWATPAPSGDPPGWLAGAADRGPGVTRALPPARALTPFRSLVAEIEAHLAAARAPPTPAPDPRPGHDAGRLWWTNELAAGAAAEPGLAGGSPRGGERRAPPTADAATCTSPQGAGLTRTPASVSGEDFEPSHAQPPASGERAVPAHSVPAGDGAARRLFAAATPGHQPPGGVWLGSEPGLPGPAPLRSPLAELPLRPPGSAARGAASRRLPGSPLAGSPSGKRRKHRKAGDGNARGDAALVQAGSTVRWAGPEGVRASGDLPARLAYLDLAAASGAGGPGQGSAASAAQHARPTGGFRPAAGRGAGGVGPDPVHKVSSKPKPHRAHAAARELPRRARHVRPGSAGPWAAHEGVGQGAGEGVPPWQGAPRSAGKPKRKRAPPGEETDAPSRPVQHETPLVSAPEKVTATIYRMPHVRHVKTVKARTT